MIGQLQNRYMLDELVKTGQVPSFMVFVGKKGQGKTTLGQYLAKQLGAAFYEFEQCTMEQIRIIIEKCYQLSTPEVYMISGGLSIRVMNALLKIVEEPPTNAYFIIATTDPINLLDTIMSRARVVYLQPYTVQQLECLTQDEVILKYASNPGQVKTMQSIDYSSLLQLLDKIVDNIGEVSAANVFNILPHLSPYYEHVDLIFDILYKKVFCKMLDKQASSRELHLLKDFKPILLNEQVALEKAFEMLFVRWRRIRREYLDLSRSTAAIP